MKTPVALSAAAVAVIGLLAGCASGEPAGSKEGSELPANGRLLWEKIEGMRADCMKQAGFKYTPTLPEVPRQVREAAQTNGSYDAMNEIRQKYGFGVFSRYVYPGKADGSDKNANPNLSYMMSLQATQLTAYNNADDKCFATALRKVTGRKITSRKSYQDQRNAITEKYYSRLVDSDPELLDLGQQFAECLKKKGYPVGRTEPRQLASRGWTMFSKQASELGAKQFKTSSLVPFTSRTSLPTRPCPT